jgi:hypothetical protein
MIVPNVPKRRLQVRARRPVSTPKKTKREPSHYFRKSAVLLRETGTYSAQRRFLLCVAVISYRLIVWFGS